ncbi:MAG: hypothetical protein ACN6OP_03770 [Pseudomonadales bacterium]
MTTLEHADIQMGDDIIDDADHELDDTPPPPARAAAKKGGVPGWLKIVSGLFGLVVLGLASAFAYKVWQQRQAAAAEAEVIMQQPAHPVQQQAGPNAGAPVPVAQMVTPPGMQPQIQPGVQPGMQAQPAIQPAPAMQQSVQAAPQEPQQAVPANEPAIAVAAAAAAAAQSPPSPQMPAVVTPPHSQQDAPALDARTAQIVRDWPREREEIQKRLANVDARLQELSVAIKALNDSRNAAAQTKPEPKPEAKPQQKAQPKKEVQAKPAAKESQESADAEQKREAAAGVVRGVPRTVAAAKAAPPAAKTTGEPTPRRDYFLTGWIGNRAFYERTGGVKEGREDSVTVGDAIDGLKVVAVDTRNRRIVLENNQYIGFR